MRSRVMTTCACYGLLVLAGGISFTLPDTLTVVAARAQPGPWGSPLSDAAAADRSTHPGFDLQQPAADGLIGALDGFVPLLEIDGPVTLAGDMTPDDDASPPALYLGDLTIRDRGDLTVAGDLRIRVDGNLSMSRCRVTLLPGAQLTLSVLGDVRISDGVSVNAAPGDTSRVSFHVLGGGELLIEKGSRVYGTIMAPSRRLRVTGASHLYGAFVGGSMVVEKDDAG